MSDLPLLIGTPLENVGQPQGPPLVHRRELFHAILDATGKTRDKLAEDGLSNDLTNQIIGNAAAHALAVLALSLDLSRTELADVFLQYCDDIEEAAKKSLRLDS
jgi:hypothetical protein